MMVTLLRSLLLGELFRFSFFKQSLLVSKLEFGFTSLSSAFRAGSGPPAEYSSIQEIPKDAQKLQDAPKATAGAGFPRSGARSLLCMRKPGKYCEGCGYPQGIRVFTDNPSPLTARCVGSACGRWGSGLWY